MYLIVLVVILSLTLSKGFFDISYSHAQRNNNLFFNETQSQIHLFINI